MKKILAAAVPLLVSACAPLAEPTTPAALSAVADPTRAVPAAQSAAPVAYTRYRVEEPGDWRTLNDEQVGG